MKRRRFLQHLGATLGTAAAGECGGTSAAASDTRVLATLMPNHARMIGYWTEPLTEQDSSIGGQPGGRTTFSSVAYDRKRKRFLMRGGHHGPNISTNVRAIEVSPFRAYSIGRNTLREDMTLANYDAERGAWRTTNAPWSRHTYNSNVVVGDKFIMLGHQNGHNAVNGIRFAVGTGRPAWRDLNEADESKAWGYSRTYNSWLMDHAACVTADGKHILLINRGQSAWGVPWLYNIAADTAQQLPFGFARSGGWVGSPCVVFYPPSGRYYAVEEHGRVWEITLDALRPAASGAVEVMPIGWPDTDAATPYRLVRLGYDPINQRIAGSLWRGTFMSFDPVTRAWTKSTPLVEAGSVGVPSTEFWCADFDAESGCYISFEANGKTWAYRPAGSGAVLPPVRRPPGPATATQ